VLLSHGHADHIGDTVAICERTGAKLVANYDLCDAWLARKGVKAIDPMNTGGTTDQGEFTVSLTQALHSSVEQDEATASRTMPGQSERHRGHAEGQGGAGRLPHGRHRHLLGHGAGR
jgi:L-ascorbate metabolism protein UlaG (beta-lactamase superfamily)